MKYVFRKIRLMMLFKNNVRNDINRTQEINKAIKYIITHPKYLFLRVSYEKIKKIKNLNASVLKNINSIINTPYVEELYEIYF